MIAAAYLLGCLPDVTILTEVCWLGVAQKVFGAATVDASVERVLATLGGWGYGAHHLRDLQGVLGAVIMVRRSPHLEALTADFLDEMRRHPGFSKRRRSLVYLLGRALAHLGILGQPLAREPVRSAHFREARLRAVAPEWAASVERWEATSTLAPKTRQTTRHWLLKAGRWLREHRPEIVAPAQWTRELAAEYVAAVDRMRIGEYNGAPVLAGQTPGKPFSPRTKSAALTAMMAFFSDAQEWGWIPVRLNPTRCFSTPKSIRAMIGPAPRVIADDIWAKLLWAGLNVTAEDFPQHPGHPAREAGSGTYYPTAMLRALAVVWLFCGLRSNEIVRLRVGCIRWQSDLSAGEGPVGPRRRTCLLDVPAHKTGRASTKPVDPAVGEAIAAWEGGRPAQPDPLDSKVGEVVPFLFSYRGRRLPTEYLNHALIPALCRKAGVPRSDAKGPLSSHRARSTIASQLANARDPMTLFELQAWLGHRWTQSTEHYVAATPTRLAQAYRDAGYFARNVRAIEVLIDQDAVKSAAAAEGAPWRFYDLGHGYCTYDFFDQCPHRMACAKCAFYEPKGSSRAQLLEGQANLLRLKQEIPLTDEERAAVEDGLAALERLCARLADVPTPAGPTPSQLMNPAIVPLMAVGPPSGPGATNDRAAANT
jgi:integrase